MCTIPTNHNKQCHINIITCLLLAQLSLFYLWRIPPTPPHTNHKTPYHIITVCYWLTFLKNTNLIFSHPFVSSISTSTPHPPPPSWLYATPPNGSIPRALYFSGKCCIDAYAPYTQHPSCPYVTKYHLRFSSPFCPLVPLISVYPMT
jgi:hypothetical protein